MKVVGVAPSDRAHGPLGAHLFEEGANYYIHLVQGASRLAGGAFKVVLEANGKVTVHGRKCKDVYDADTARGSAATWPQWPSIGQRAATWRIASGAGPSVRSE